MGLGRGHVVGARVDEGQPTQQGQHSDTNNDAYGFHNVLGSLDSLSPGATPTHLRKPTGIAMTSPLAGRDDHAQPESCSINGTGLLGLRV